MTCSIIDNSLKNIVCAPGCREFNALSPDHVTKGLVQGIFSSLEVENLRARAAETHAKPHSKNRFVRVKSLEFKEKNKEHHSIASRIISWIANSQISVFTTVIVLKATRAWMSIAVPSEKLRNNIDRQVDELSGSSHLSKVFHLISPVLSLKIQAKLLSLNLNSGLYKFLKNELSTLQTFIDVMLPTMYVNLANNIKEHSLNLKEEKAISLIDVISLLVEMIEAHIPNIHANYDRINSISDENRRNQKLCKLFSPITDDFLAIAVPHGVKDLVFTQIPVLSNTFWKSLKKTLLPSLSISIYQQLALPFKEKCQNQLKQKFGGEYLATIAESAGKNAAGSAALVFANSEANLCEENADKNLLTNKLIKNFTSLLDGSDQLKIWVANWLAKQFSLFGRSADPHINSIWKMLGSYVEILLIHVFENLLKPQEGASVNEQSKDVLGHIFYRLSLVTNNFFDQNRIAIERRIAFLVDVKNVEEDEELLILFNTYASLLLKAMGLYEFEEIPLPEFTQDSFVKSLQDVASKFLLRQYFAIASLSN